jgi:hypothetical protein
VAELDDILAIPGNRPVYQRVRELLEARQAIDLCRRGRLGAALSAVGGSTEGPGRSSGRPLRARPPRGEKNVLYITVL